MYFRFIFLSSLVLAFPVSASMSARVCSAILQAQMMRTQVASFTHGEYADIAGQLRRRLFRPVHPEVLQTAVVYYGKLFSNDHARWIRNKADFKNIRVPSLSHEMYFFLMALHRMETDLRDEGGVPYALLAWQMEAFGVPAAGFGYLVRSGLIATWKPDSPSYFVTRKGEQELASVYAFYQSLADCPEIWNPHAPLSEVGRE